VEALRWAILQLVWSAKGYSIKEMPVHFEREFRERDESSATRPTRRRKKNGGFSASTLTRRIKENEEAPHKVVEFVLNDTKLPIKEKQPREPYSVVRLGLAALDGKPAPETPAAFAEHLRSEFPTDSVALQLADALAKQGGPLDTLRAQFDALTRSVGASVVSLLAPLDTLGAKLDALASYLLASLASVGSKLDALASSVGAVLASLASLATIARKLDRADGKLDAMASKVDHVQRTLAVVGATVNDADAKGDVAGYARERETLSILRALGRVCGAVALLAVVGLVGFAGMLALLVSGRWAHRDSPTATTASATQPPAPLVVVVNGATGTMIDLRDYLGALADMGKKVQERWVPGEPLPYQKLAKDCDARLGERAIHGGCWAPIAHKPPPCELLYRYGDECYRPIAADPTKPVGLFPDQR